MDTMGIVPYLDPLPEFTPGDPRYPYIIDPSIWEPTTHWDYGVAPSVEPWDLGLAGMGMSYPAEGESLVIPFIDAPFVADEEGSYGVIGSPEKEGFRIGTRYNKPVYVTENTSAKWTYFLALLRQDARTSNIPSNIIITGGWEDGHSPNSAHLYGTAIDFAIAGWPNSFGILGGNMRVQASLIMQMAQSAGFVPRDGYQNREGTGPHFHLHNVGDVRLPSTVQYYGPSSAVPSIPAPVSDAWTAPAMVSVFASGYDYSDMGASASIFDQFVISPSTVDSLPPSLGVSDPFSWDYLYTSDFPELGVVSPWAYVPPGDSTSGDASSAYIPTGDVMWPDDASNIWNTPIPVLYPSPYATQESSAPEQAQDNSIILMAREKLQPALQTLQGMYAEGTRFETAYATLDRSSIRPDRLAELDRAHSVISTILGSVDADPFAIGVTVRVIVNYVASVLGMGENYIGAFFVPIILIAGIIGSGALVTWIMQQKSRYDAVAAAMKLKAEYARMFSEGRITQSELERLNKDADPEAGGGGTKADFLSALGNPISMAAIAVAVVLFLEGRRR